MKATSFITDGKPYPTELKGPLCLHPDQLALEALEILLEHDLDALTVHENGICIGVVYLKELIWFLTCDNKDYNLLFHKFNFDLRSAVAIIQRKSYSDKDNGVST
jgi:CBS domain-containing protein